MKKILLQREKRRMNATLVRKSFVSGSRQDHVSASAPGLKSRLSSMMCHSKNMADRDYFLPSLEEIFVNKASESL